MKDLKIVFMGTPDFAVAILKELLEKKHNIVGVITAPDKPAGRGRKLNESAVKKFAVANNLTLLQPTNLKDEGFLKELKALEANLQIIVAFRMLPQQVWAMPELGTFNLHASLLPDYRGAAPINWAIINGETETGVSTFYLDDKIDTGEIILQEKTSIGENETVGELHDKLMLLGSDLVSKTVTLIQEGKVSTTKQPDKVAKSAYKIHTDTCKIDWTKSTDEIGNLIRGLNPYPAAWCFLHNAEKETKVKIFDIEKIMEVHTYRPGAIISTKKTMKVATVDGFIQVNSLQISGKKRMDTASLLNGFSINETVFFR
ncbi:methionyl-tRNA formyltransferase [Flavicella sediminum]|uniref:methionyl-tRNA formyltransferase n=1 Tax=Flavicella sediminum TaxID=2585141 RepID=UPI001123E873|nr:methionyl-tRNA formyltransferase [Flavicella sediminum]